MTAMLPTLEQATFAEVPKVTIPSLGAGSDSKLLQIRFDQMNGRGLSAAPTGSLLDAEKELSSRLFSKSAQLKILISKVSMHLPDEWRRKFFHKLDSLHDPDNWEEDDNLVDASAFVTFLRFVLQVGPLERTSIGVSPEGHFLIGWKRDCDSLALEFLPNDAVHWSVVRHQTGGQESVAGRTVVGRLSAVLQPYALKDWFLNGGTKRSED